MKVAIETILGGETLENLIYHEVEKGTDWTDVLIENDRGTFKLDVKYYYNEVSDTRDLPGHEVLEILEYELTEAYSEFTEDSILERIELL